MTEIKRTPTPWNLCYHLRSPEHDASCKCGYRGSIWSADGEYIVLEMGSSPDIDGRGKIQGHTQPQASRPVQLADAALIVEAVNSHASLTAERDRLREALEFYADELTWADTNPKNDGRLTVLVPSPSFAEIDRGERARAALSPEESK